ncbi:hypothetical protein [Pedobacter soli]|uniref:Uncharacterized protein n=1 Tax=Pedobacter soli TaxID=390242 RepID=A0A1G6JQ72_9SPHI|nr:hypothetical protein [Pedobacter soli]SDC20890.1 hypothetical protein SAMN04488024_101522 [Pedobacter soli]
MIFILNIKPVISTSEIRDFLLSRLKLKSCDINELLGENDEALINYEIKIRDYHVEFRTELLFFLSDQTCLELKIYNSLQIALLFCTYFNIEVVIDDGSNDPYRWILVERNEMIYVVDEKIGADDDFSINYKSKKEIPVEEVMKVLPGKDYFLLAPGERPTFVNTDPTWNKRFYS